MANVRLSNADNVDCLYAGQTMSLFMNLSRPSDVVAHCVDSTVEDIPIALSLTLQRVDGVVVRIPTSSRGLIVRSQPEYDVGGDIVSFALESCNLLKVTLDLALCSERSRQLSSSTDASTAHVLVDQSWVINDTFTLKFQLRSTAHGTWSMLANPQWTEVLPGSNPSNLLLSPISSYNRRDTSESSYHLGEDSLARPLSTVRSTTGRTTRLFDPSEPRSQLQRALFIDQTLFPIISIYFLPELYTRTISTPPNIVRNMSLQISIEKNVVRRPRRTNARTAARGRLSTREPRQHGETLNLEVAESFPISNAEWEDGTKTPRQFKAVVLSFNADYRDRSGNKARYDDSDACDVARANRLVVDDFTFNVLVTAKKQADTKVEVITRTVYSYCGEHEELNDVLDLDLDDLMEYIYDRYSYIKTTPYLDSLSFHDAVWQAVRLYLLNRIAEGEDGEMNMDDGTLLMDSVLASA